MHYWVLLANTSEISQAVARHLRNSGSLRANWEIIAALIGIAIFWCMLYYAEAWIGRLRRLKRAPRSLFNELCAAHQLTRQERSLLAGIARSLNIRPEAVIFVDHRILRRVVDVDEAHRQLAGKLFGGEFLVKATKSQG